MKVVICDHVFPDLEEEKRALACVPDLELIDARCTCKEDVIAACADADAVLNQYNYLTEEVVDSFKNCKVIATYGIGLDKIDVDAASRRGIYLCNSPDYNKSEVADHIAAMVLALERHLVEFNDRVRRGDYPIPYEWMKPHRPCELTVGFVGFGRIARQAAKKLSDAFEMRVIAYDPFLSAEEITSAGGRKAELDEVMRESDFVSINVSLLPSTRDLIGRRALALMKPTAFLINCSRGGIVNEEDLIEALEKKRIAGAGLDTFTREPLPKDSPFCRLDNVIMTPHAAWYTVEAMGDVQRVAAEQVALVLTGQKPTRCVNYEEANKYKNRRTQWNRRR